MVIVVVEGAVAVVAVLVVVVEVGGGRCCCNSGGSCWVHNVFPAEQSLGLVGGCSCVVARGGWGCSLAGHL